MKFIMHAQRMGFSLVEIGHLLNFRAAPTHARPEVQRLAGEKLADIEDHLQELKKLRDELDLLINRCAASKDGCPIIAGLDDD